MLSNLVRYFHHRGWVVPDVLIAIDGRDLMRVALLAMLMVVIRGFFRFRRFFSVVVAVRGQRQGVDDLVLVFDGVVEPGVISAAAHNNHVGFSRACQVRSGRFEVVRVHVVAFNNGGDFYIRAFR